MQDAVVFLTEGFEEVEALTAVDVLRRGGCDTVTVSLTAEARATGSHAVTVLTDTTFDAWREMGDTGKDTVYILPGGPGTARYHAHAGFVQALQAHHGRGGRIAAICAAPSVLGALGMAAGKRVVCYPGFESALDGATMGQGCVETDGTLITAIGPAASLLFALEVLRAIKGDAAVETVRQQMLEPSLKAAYA